MPIKKILTIDGGGIRGIIPAVICSHIEHLTGRRIYQIFDLISGTSTGSILGAGLSIGIPAEYMLGIYLTHGKEIFTKRVKWFRPWEYITKPEYDKNVLMDHLINVYGEDTKISDAKTHFMTTAYNVLTEQNEFFTSWQPRYKEMNLNQVIEMSVSAPYYFGRYIDKDNKKVYSDGAVGIYNNTAVIAAIESIKLGWGDSTKYILNLGCGSTTRGVKYDDVVKWHNIEEIIMYYRRKDYQTNDLKNTLLTSDLVRNVVLENINPLVLKKEYPIDSVQYMDKFYEYGKLCYPDVEKLEILKHI